MQFDDKSLAPYQGSKPYIFLSYSHRDAEPAAEIIRGMNRDQFRIWYDEGLVPGKEWDENIARAIMGCSYFVALMSANYLDSANCRDELNFARDKKLPLLLLYLEDVELPAGMEMRLGRMLAIHTHKFVRKEQVFAKIRTANGISICRDVPEGEAPAEPWEEAELPAPALKSARKGRSRVLAIALPLAAAAVLAVVLLLTHRAPLQALPDPAPTAAPVQESAAPTAAPAPVTAAPAGTPAPAAPAPTEAPVQESPAPETPTEPPAEETPAPEASAEALAYQEAERLQAAGRTAPAALAFYKLGDYRDAAARSQALWQAAVRKNTVSIGTELSIGLKEDGTVVFAGKLEKSKAELTGWGNLIAVAAGYEHSLGLLADGTVVSKGLNVHGERSLSGWKDIVSIAAGNEISVGLCADGTVVARGSNDAGQCDVEQWRDIVDIAVGAQHTVGLRADGTVETAGYNSNGQRDVEEWTDIVAVAAGNYHTLGLRADGTVVATGYNPYGQCNVSDWTDIVAIAAGKRHSVGLRADGTVVAVGSNSSGQCDVSDWTDVIEISCGELTTIALRRDGTAVACGENADGKCEVGRWTELRLPADALG